MYPGLLYVMACILSKLYLTYHIAARPVPDVSPFTGPVSKK